jgi:hypothetical protein
VLVRNNTGADSPRNFGLRKVVLTVLVASVEEIASGAVPGVLDAEALSTTA